MSNPGYALGHPAPLSWATERPYNLTTLARGMWGHYLFDEPSGVDRADSSGRGHDLTCDVAFGRDEGFSTPFAAVLDGNKSAISNHSKQMDSLVDQWGFACGLYIPNPAEEALVLIHGLDTPNQCGLKVLWNEIDLVFRMQTGFYPGHENEVGYEYKNDIVITDLAEDDWYFVAGSFRGPSTSQDGPVTENLMTLRVNDETNSVAAMPLDGENPPEHETLADFWYVGNDYVGRIGPLTIYERAPSDGELTTLYNNGDWLVPTP